MLLKIAKDELAFLCFRPVKLDLTNHYWAYFCFGFISTWLCGVGRFWDDIEAKPWQIMGAGSLIYVFFLAFALWIIIMPLNPANWSYKGVLLFVMMTSPPAFLYAIPVERFVDVYTAIELNMSLLGVVAAWRVALLIQHLWKVAELGLLKSVIACVFPLVAIIIIIFILGGEDIVINTMGGLRHRERLPDAQDGVNGILMTFMAFSFFLFPIIFIAYLFTIGFQRIPTIEESKQDEVSNHNDSENEV